METAESLYAKGVDCMARGDLEGAITAFQKAVETDPEMADAWEGLSIALADAARWDEAIAAAGRVVALQPEEELAYANLSRICQRAGRIEEAESWAAKARLSSWKRQLSENED